MKKGEFEEYTVSFPPGTLARIEALGVRKYKRADFIRDAVERALMEAELAAGNRPNVPPEVEVVARGLARAAAAEREGIEDDPMEQEAIAEAEWQNFVKAAMDVLDEVQQVTGKKR